MAVSGRLPSVITHASSFAPTVVVIATGWVYLIGYWVRHKYLYQFGLSGGAISPNIQEVVAYGFPPSIFTAILSIIAYSILIRLMPKQHVIAYFAMGLSYFIFTPGTSSQTYAWILANTKRQELADTDRTYLYFTKASCFKGVVIIQDAAHVFLLTSMGIAVLKTDDLNMILPASEKRPGCPIRSSNQKVT